MDIESFLKKLTLKVYGMLADEGRRVSIDCWGMLGSTWSVKARVEVYSLECFDCGLSLWLKLDRTRKRDGDVWE